MKALHQTSYMHLTEEPMVVYSDCHIFSGAFFITGICSLLLTIIKRVYS